MSTTKSASSLQTDESESGPGTDRALDGLRHLGFDLSRDPVGNRVNSSFFYGRDSLSGGWRRDVSVRALTRRKIALAG